MLHVCDQQPKRQLFLIGTFSLSLIDSEIAIGPCTCVAMQWWPIIIGFPRPAIFMLTPTTCLDADHRHVSFTMFTFHPVQAQLVELRMCSASLLSPRQNVTNSKVPVFETSFFVRHGPGIIKAQQYCSGGLTDCPEDIKIEIYQKISNHSLHKEASIESVSIYFPETLLATLAGPLSHLLYQMHCPPYKTPVISNHLFVEPSQDCRSASRHDTVLD